MLSVQALSKCYIQQAPCVKVTQVAINHNVVDETVVCDICCLQRQNVVVYNNSWLDMLCAYT